MKKLTRIILLTLVFIFVNTLFVCNAKSTELQKGIFFFGSDQIKDYDIKQEYTIKEITFPKWYSSRTFAIDVYFSDRINLKYLKNKLNVIPPVRIDWYNAREVEHNTYRIFGRFKPGSNYFLKIDDSFVSERGRKYVETINSFVFPDEPPKIIFTDKKTVIERKSRQLIHTRLINVDELNAKVVTIPPALIPKVLDVGHTRVEEIINSDKSRDFIDKLKADNDFRVLTGESETDAKLFFTHVPKNKDKEYSVPLGFRENAGKGAVVAVTVSNNRSDAAAKSISRVFRITDLGISYKASQKSLLVWITSLNSGKPMDDVKVFVVTKDKRFLYLGESNGDGVVIVKEGKEFKGFNAGQDYSFANIGASLPLDQVKTLIAVTDDDVSYINTNEGAVKPVGIKQASMAPKKEKFNKGLVFTERGIYRPGETVFFKGTLRHYKPDGGIELPKDSGAIFIIKNSKGEEVYNETRRFSEFGTANGSFRLKPYFPLGVYTLFMKPINGKEDYARRTFQVQEFRPPRHMVDITYKHETEETEDYIGLKKKAHFLKSTIEGRYYSGGPVQNGKVQWKVYYSSSDYKLKDYEGYSFSHPMIVTRELVESGESMLDDSGKLSIRVPISNEVIAGNYGLEVIATVVDIDGRPATGKSLYQHEPDYLVGISRHKEKVSINEKQHLNVIVLDKKRKEIKSGRLKVEVMREGYTYVKKTNLNGNTYWDRKKIWRKEFSTSVSIIKKKAEFDFDFSRGGVFLVRFSYTGDDDHVYNSGVKYTVGGPGYYGYYGYYDSQQQKDPAAKDRLIFLQTERPSYEVGDKIRLYASTNLKLSYCLVTIEREGVLDYDVIEGKDLTDITLKAEDEYSPNVYVSVLGTKARGEFPVYGTEVDFEAPNYAYGYANVTINKSSSGFEVNIGDNEVELFSEPGEEFTVDLVALDPKGKGVVAEMAVAVVDESVLALTGYVTPTLSSLTRFTYPLLVNSFELRHLLILQTPFGFLHNEPLTGGGGPAMALGRKKDPVTVKIRKDFNPVAYFNPSVITDENGKASVTFKLPDQMTSFRVFTVACDKSGGFDSSERLLRVSKDFYVQPGIPRFMTKGDKARILVAAFNKTGDYGTMSFFAEANENIRLGPVKDSYKLGQYERRPVPVEANAVKPGTGELTFSGEFKDKQDVIKVKLPVNLGMPLESKVHFGNFTKEKEIWSEINSALGGLSTEDVGPDEITALITLSDSPFVKLSEGLKYLLRYPYGCVEQTSSKTLALAGLYNNIKNGSIPQISLEETEKFLKAGVDRILSMQIDSGAFGYWPGNRRPHHHGTIYAMTALTLSKQAGMEVPQGAIDKACGHLIKEINRYGKDDLQYKAFAVYILALNGKLTQSDYSKVMGDYNRMPQEARLLCLIAGNITDYESYDSLRQKLLSALDWSDSNYRYRGFYAPYRRNAIRLLVTKTILGADDSKTGNEALKIIEGIKTNGRWSATSDTGWCLFALGEYFEKTSLDREIASVTVYQDGVSPQELSLEYGKSVTAMLDIEALLKNPRVRIETDTNKLIIYKLSLKYPKFEYLRNGYSNGFTIKKMIENTNVGKPIRVGDIVKVKLTFDVERYKGYYKNYVVIDDPLPAGLVAINTALKTEEATLDDKEDSSSQYRYWSPDGYYRFRPNFFEMRDDRVLAFRDYIWGGKYQYSYYARAICEGEYYVPPTKIQMMYETDYVGYTPRAKITIEAMPDVDE
jgi:uncharacterized protein YfaS (alpha-2-macroglobulin family)